MDYIVYGVSATSATETTVPKRFRKTLCSIPKSRLSFDSDGCLQCKSNSDNSILSSGDFCNEKCVLLLKSGKPIIVSLKEDEMTIEYALKLFAPRPVGDDDDEEPKLVIGFHVATFYSEKTHEKDVEVEIRRHDVFQRGAKLATFQKALRAVFLDLGLERPTEFATVNMMFCADPLWQRLVERQRLASE